LTGAATGIGAAAALLFAERGYNLALLDCAGEELAAVAAEARERGAQVLEFVGDVSDLAFGEAAVIKTHQEWNRIDLLVNNAAWRELVTMRTISLESWEKTLAVCLTAPAFLARWCARYMEEAGQGVI